MQEKTVQNAWGQPGERKILNIFSALCWNPAAALVQQHSQIIPQVLVLVHRKQEESSHSKEEQAGPKGRRAEGQWEDAWEIAHQSIGEDDRKKNEF